MSDSEEFECPYCDESFESEHEKGVHVSENHVDGDSIPRIERTRDKTTDITRDWDKEED